MCWGTSVRYEKEPATDILAIDASVYSYTSQKNALKVSYKDRALKEEGRACVVVNNSNGS